MILNDKELEALIREEFSAATPDNFDIILERIQASRNQKEQETRTNKRAVSNLMKLAWAAVLVLVLGTGIVGYRSTKIPTDAQCILFTQGFGEGCFSFCFFFSPL